LIITHYKLVHRAVVGMYRLCFVSIQRQTVLCCFICTYTKACNWCRFLVKILF